MTLLLCLIHLKGVLFEHSLPDVSVCPWMQQQQQQKQRTTTTTTTTTTNNNNNK
jgi:hypothetical protein